MRSLNSFQIIPGSFHIFIPLQSGSDKILRLMKRRYSRDLFRERVETITGKLQYAGIGTDIITGFPGESEGF